MTKTTGRRGFLKALGWGAVAAVVVKPDVGEAPKAVMGHGQLDAVDGQTYFAWGSEPLTGLTLVTSSTNLAIVADFRKANKKVRHG